MVWLSCEGETEADKEWLGGVTYTPWQVTQPHFLQLVFALRNSAFILIYIQTQILDGKSLIILCTILKLTQTEHYL